MSSMAVSLNPVAGALAGPMRNPYASRKHAPPENDGRRGRSRGERQAGGGRERASTTASQPHLSSGSASAAKAQKSSTSAGDAIAASATGRRQTMLLSRVAAAISGSSIASKPRGARLSESSADKAEPRLLELRRHRLERLGAARGRRAEPRELIGIRQVEAGGEETFLGRQVEIEEPGIVLSPRPGQHDAGIGLVRILVGGEAHVAMDAEQRGLAVALDRNFRLSPGAPRHPRPGRPSAL